ncbi:hypothetical protein SAY87_021871 [Trapa incisa]|nr:hypothetical protein SAY87_021871 [Trapa incisa]
MPATAPFRNLDINLVSLSGTINEGNIAPNVGLLDIGVSDSAYLFRLALPGILKEPNGLKCEVNHSGRVQIQADMASPSARKDSLPGTFRFITPQLSLPGPFSVSFNLPGPVDARLFTPITRQDGVLEVVIMKSKRPGASVSSMPEAPAQTSR